MAFRFIDTHCFAGGLTLGLIQGGDFELVGKKESQGGFGAENMEVNRHLVGENWQTQTGNYPDWEPIDAQFIAANPPCSGFSTISSKAHRGINSPVNKCMWGVAEYAARVKPEIFIMESVQQAYTQGYELMVALRAHLEQLSGLQYDLTHVLHSARSVGSPQLRRRYMLVCHRVPFGVELPTPKMLPTVRDCIDDLWEMPTQWEPQPYRRFPVSEWAEEKRTSDGLVDGHMYPQNLGQRRMEYLMQTGRWTPGKEYSELIRELYDNDIPLADYFKPYSAYIEADWKFGWRSPYVIRPDHTAPVITGNGPHGIGHYAEHRILTQREVARLMGFPDNWLIEPNKKYKYLTAGWGKGVTVDVGRYFGEWVSNSLSGNPGSLRGELIGERERLINFTNYYKVLQNNLEQAA